MTSTKPYHHGDLRTELLEAVRQLVERHGPDGFSVAEAARAAGVSSAAPYKHFKDRNEILRALVITAMDRLRLTMKAARDTHPVGSLAAVSAIGQAYINFARTEPGVFRIMFGLTDGHKADPEVLDTGLCCFMVVVEAVASCLQVAAADPLASRRAYMLWSFVHGHSFLMIDEKVLAQDLVTDETAYLEEISRGILQLS